MSFKGDDSDGLEAFSIDESTGIIRTRVTLDHEERAFYRLAVSVKDQGRPPKETVRHLQVEVLDLNDNRPTFSTSSFSFKVCLALVLSCRLLLLLLAPLHILKIFHIYLHLHHHHHLPIKKEQEEEEANHPICFSLLVRFLFTLRERQRNAIRQDFLGLLFSLCVVVFFVFFTF